MNISDASVYNIVLWVFTSISGLVTVSNSGKISAINDNFCKFLCGHHSTELINKVCEIMWVRCARKVLI